MKVQISQVLEVLRTYGINPDEELDVPSFPEIGTVEDGEAIYSTSIKDVFDDNEDEFALNLNDPRVIEWWHEIEDIIAGAQVAPRRPPPVPKAEPWEPVCAWYCPIHFYGSAWGIYIRESCILDSAKRIASFVDWRLVTAGRSSIALQLLRSAFYVFFLHEQFHHKVESLGFRFLISTSADRYRPYKAKIHRPAYLTTDCLEESLGNAESYRRLSEERYIKRVDRPIRDGARDFLRASMPLQPPDMPKVYSTWARLSSEMRCIGCSLAYWTAK